MQQASQLESNDCHEIKYPGLGLTIYAKLNRPKEEIQDNIRINCARRLPQVWPHKEQDTVLAIAGGGPSLVDTLDDLKAFKEDGGKVVALAGTAKYLMEHGITPSAHVLLDSSITNIDFVTDADCTYLVASQCDPRVFDALAGRKLYIWHAINHVDDNEIISQFYDKWVPIQGGNTIGLRALRLFQVLGYRKFELFGYDSCYIDGRHHAYKQKGHDDIETTWMEVNGRKFEVAAYQIQQAMEFMKMVKVFGQGWEVRCHGNGLISYLIEEGQKYGSDSLGVL